MPFSCAAITRLGSMHRIVESGVAESVRGPRLGPTSTVIFDSSAHAGAHLASTLCEATPEENCAMLRIGISLYDKISGRGNASPGACTMQKRLRLPGSLAISTIFFAGCGKMGLPPAGPPSVEVVQVVQKDVPITRDWVATLDGFVNAQIRAQVNGLLLKQNYANGSYVRKDDPLFEIDPRPFQAALDQANGNLQQAKANLQRAEAQLGKTQLDVARYTPLAKESAISQQELDDAVQADLAAKAQTEQAKAAIESARAAVESAKLNLGFAQIVSPIDGVAAISTAQVGDFVGPQSGALTTVSTVDPILVSIMVSEQEYLRAIDQIRQQNKQQGRSLTEDAALRTLEWQLKLADGTI